MEEDLIQINGETLINVDVSVRNIIHVKKVTFGALLDTFVKMENM